MFKKLYLELTNARLELAEEELKIKAAIKESEKLRKQNKDLLSKINEAEKRGGCLLLSDLNEELIQKLQLLTDDNVVIIFLENDGSRIEIRKDNYIQKRAGVIR